MLLSVCIGPYGQSRNRKSRTGNFAWLDCYGFEVLSVLSNGLVIFQEVSAALLEGSASCVRKFAFRDAARAVGALLPQETLDQLLQPLHTSYLNNVGFDWNSILCWNLVELQLINLLEDSSPTETLLVQLLNANPAIRRLKLGTTDLIFYESNLPSIKLLELQTLELNMGSQFMS